MENDERRSSVTSPPRRLTALLALGALAATALVGGTASTASAAPTVGRAAFSPTIPAAPTVTGKVMGTVHQNDRVAARDNGTSAKLDGKSYWIFDDTILEDPWGMYSSTAAVTQDLNASDGIDLVSGDGFSTAAAAPRDLVPHTAAEVAFEKAHDEASTGCTAATDQYCGATFAYWPGATVADTVNHRILFTYGKLCRGGADGTPCSGWLGKDLGTGVAALDPKTKTVTRLTGLGRTAVAQSIEGADPTIVWGDGSAPVQTGDVVVKGLLYTEGGARVPLTQINDLSAYRYWTGSAWVADRTKLAANGFIRGAAGGTQFWSAAIASWVNVYMPYGTNKVMYQVAGQPMGPWSAEHLAFTVPAGDGTTYALFAHPEYAQGNGSVQYLTWYDHESGHQGLAQMTLTKATATAATRSRG